MCSDRCRPLHRSHSLDWILSDELGIGPRQGSSKVEENTTSGDLVSSAMASSSLVLLSDSEASDSAANPYMSRYVFAPIRIV